MELNYRSKSFPVSEEDVSGLKLPQIRSLMKDMQLSLKGIHTLYEAQLYLKTEIIKTDGTRSKGKRELSAILKNIKEEHARKCNLLIKFMNAIETKIDLVPKNDPLWKQLNIICENYKEIFDKLRKELKETVCKLLVTGETCAGKTSVINNLLGEVVLPESFLCNTQAFTEISYAEQCHAKAYRWIDGPGVDPEPLEIFPEEGKDFLLCVKEKIEARENITSHGDFKRIEIQLNNKFLKESEVTIVDTPGVGDNPKTTRMVFEHLKEAFAFVFVLNTENRGGVQDRISALAREVATNLQIDANNFFRPESAIFIGNKWDKTPVTDHDRLQKFICENIAQFWPGFKSEQFLPYSATETAAVLKSGFMTKQYCELLDRFETLVPVGSDNKLRLHFVWITNMVRKVIYALKIHVSNRQKDLKKKKSDFEQAISRLSELERVTVKDLKAFKKELNGVVDSLVTKMKQYILSDQVHDKLSRWDGNEFPLATDWRELERRLYEKLAMRLDGRMQLWDLKNKELENAMNGFQMAVEGRVSTIGKELEDAMNLVSSPHGEQKDNIKSADDADGRGWFRPFLHSLTTFERAFLGYSAVVLFPAVAVVAVSAFIYLSSIKLIDIISSYFKGHEFEKYKDRPSEYLRICSRTLIKKYCDSKSGLRAQVIKMMGPWHEFVDKLSDIIPVQIGKDKNIIETYKLEENTDTELNVEYSYRLEGLGAVQKALRHFEMFNLNRTSKDVPRFYLSDVAFIQNEESKICGGFVADVYHANFCILSAPTKEEKNSMIQDGFSITTAQLSSIVEQQTAQPLERLGESTEQATLSLADNIDGKIPCVHHETNSSDGNISFVTNDFFSALKCKPDSLGKDDSKVKEVPCSLLDSVCPTGDVMDDKDKVKEVMPCSLHASVSGTDDVMDDKDEVKEVMPCSLQDSVSRTDDVMDDNDKVKEVMPCSLQDSVSGTDDVMDDNDKVKEVMPCLLQDSVSGTDDVMDDNDKVKEVMPCSLQDSVSGTDDVMDDKDKVKDVMPCSLQDRAVGTDDVMDKDKVKEVMPCSLQDRATGTDDVMDKDKVKEVMPCSLQGSVSGAYDVIDKDKVKEVKPCSLQDSVSGADDVMDDKDKVKEVMPCSLQDSVSRTDDVMDKDKVKEVKPCSLQDRVSGADDVIDKDKVKEFMPCQQQESAKGTDGVGLCSKTSGSSNTGQALPGTDKTVVQGAAANNKQPKIFVMMNKIRQQQAGVASGQGDTCTPQRNVRTSASNQGQDSSDPTVRSKHGDNSGNRKQESLVAPGRIGHFSIRCLRHEIIEKEIYDYIAEEQCYRRHQCQNLVKFTGTCISNFRIYHKLEPLKCSLRTSMLDKLWSGSQSDKDKYNIIRDSLLSILEGLVYLHTKDLTSLSLSLDTIAVDTNDVTKLTNISSQRRVFVSEKQLKAMTEEDIRSHRYLALEVFDQEKYTSKSDMYSFGLLIWEILRGEVVFEKDFTNKKSDLKTAEKFMVFIKTRRPVLPDSELCLLDADFVNHLIKIQNKCWHFEVNQRITSEECMGLVRREPRPPPVPVMRF